MPFGILIDMLIAVWAAATHSVASVLQSGSHAGASASLLGFDLPLDLAHSRVSQKTRSHGYPTVLLRLVITALAVYLWTTAVDDVFPIASSHPGTTHPDSGHQAFTPIRTWLLAGDGSRAVSACAASAVLSDLIILVAVAVSLLGPTFRPMLTVCLVLLARRILLFVGAELAVQSAPSTEWPVPDGWPTLFECSHRFFSARVALSNVAAMELLAHSVYQTSPLRHGESASVWSRVLTAVAAAVGLLFTVGLTLALRVSWTMDVLVSLCRVLPVLPEYQLTQSSTVCVCAGCSGALTILYDRGGPVITLHRRVHATLLGHRTLNTSRAFFPVFECAFLLTGPFHFEHVELRLYRCLHDAEKERARERCL